MVFILPSETNPPGMREGSGVMIDHQALQARILGFLIILSLQQIGTVTLFIYFIYFVALILSG